MSKLVSTATAQLRQALAQAIQAAIDGLRDEGQELIVLDAPTLFESGCDRFCDAVISVVAKEELRLERIISRDGLTREEAEARIRAQHKESWYVRRSDFVLENNGSEEELRLALSEVLVRIRQGERPRLERAEEPR